MSRSVLLVDDEPMLLQTYERLLADRFDVTTACGTTEALALLDSKGPFAVVVTDQQMPGMSGVAFLSRIRSIAPDTVRVMLTGCADLSAAVQAVNEGSVFRFLTKPCPSDVIANALEAAIRQHDLVVAEKVLLEKTLSGVARMLTEILNLVNPGASGRADRIRQCVRHMAESLGLAHLWQFELAALLSHIGCVTLSPATLAKAWSGQQMSAEEEQIYRSHPAVGAALLANIPRLEAVSRMIARQQLDPGDTEDDAPAAVLGGELLRLALTMEHRLSQGKTVTAVVSELRRTGVPERLLRALDGFEFKRASATLQFLNVDQLSVGMVLDEDVHSKNGLLLVSRGHEATTPVILRLRSFAGSTGVVEPIRVLIPAASAQAEAA